MSIKLQITPDERLFIANLPLLLKHREAIWADPEWAGVVVGVSNGLAYTGAFKPATLGDYLNWWEKCPELSHDRNDRLIWKIQGSQLSGVHACQAIDENGDSCLARLKSNLSAVARSFLDNRCHEASEMTITQLISKLTNG